jgi:hypothetical protein
MRISRYLLFRFASRYPRVPLSNSLTLGDKLREVQPGFGIAARFTASASSINL